MHNHQETSFVLYIFPLVFLLFFIYKIKLKANIFSIVLSSVLVLIVFLHIVPVQHVYANHHGGDNSTHPCCMSQIATLPEVLIHEKIQLPFIVFFQNADTSIHLYSQQIFAIRAPPILHS